jgi:hypothetical protein
LLLQGVSEVLAERREQVQPLLRSKAARGAVSFVLCHAHGHPQHFFLL